MKTQVMTVTPEQAQKWLEGNTHNRTLRSSTVERYARDMTEGNWRLSHQGIAFDDKGTLIDGQHRLWAVFTSGVSISTMVTHGLDMAAQEVIDGGEVRVTRDALTLRGEENVPPVLVAIAKLMSEQLLHVRNPTRQEQLATWDVHSAAIRFAGSCFPRNVRGVRKAPVMTPVARAYYSRAQTGLVTFGSVLCDGVSTSRDEAPIIMLRNWLLEKSPKRQDIYGKTERALWAYLEFESIKILYVASEELFPLPQEHKPTLLRKKRKSA